MTRFLRFAAVVAVVCFAVGCEWEGSGDSDSWNDSYSWANFGGVYRPLSGATYVVAAFAPQPGSADTTQTTTFSLGTGNGLDQRTFSGTLPNIPVVAGSVSVTAGSFAVNDSDGDGNFSGNGSGTIIHSSGGISVKWDIVPSSNTEVIVTYTYYVSGTTPNPQAGSSDPIYSLTVNQTGNSLSMLDNNGVTYSGTISSMSQGGGDMTGATSGGIIGNFSVSGSNGSTMNGTLQGTYTSPTDLTSDSSSESDVPQTGRLANRVMTGTYISSGGSTGDLRGQAGTINVTVTTGTSPTTNSVQSVVQ